MSGMLAGKYHPKLGRLTEGIFEREVGKANADNALFASLRHPQSFLPVMGTPFMVHRGVAVPRIGGGGFSSLSDLIAEATSGKRDIFNFNKVGTAGVIASSNSLWNVGNLPAAGGVAAAAPGGAAPDKTSTGAIKGWANAASGDTLHMVNGYASSTVAGNTLMLYDRIFHVTSSLSSVNAAVTGVPTRYVADATEAGQNFLSMELTTLMSATAVNATITYKDQDNNTAEAAAAHALTVSSAVNRIPLPNSTYNFDLNTGDTGLRSITNIATSAANTGVANFFIGHPLAIYPCPIANLWTPQDSINTSFNLARVRDDACIALIELNKPATTATTYAGMVVLVSG